MTEYESGFDVIHSIDTEVPNGVLILNLENMEDKASFLFVQADNVFGFNGCGGFAKWKVPESGMYFIFCQMTSGDPRPLSVWTTPPPADDQDKSATLDFKGHVANDVTGSWASESIQWYRYGPVAVEAGTMKISTEGYWPHVKRFVLVPTKSGSPTSLTATNPVVLKSSQIDLPKLSHAKVAERVASIPFRKNEENDCNNFVAVLREPKRKSDNVHISSSFITVHGNHGFYEFEFINESFADTVYFDITYSSGESRPIHLSVNGGISMAENICSSETGGYGVGDFIHERFGPHPIQPEVNAIKITATGYFPHIGEIRVVDSRIDSKNVTELSQGTWIVPPSRPMRLDLIEILKDFCFLENTQEPNPLFEPDPDFYNGINCDGLWVLTSKEVDERVLQSAAELVCRYIPIELRRLCLLWRAPLGMPQGPFRLVILDPETNQQAGHCPDFPDEWKGRNGTSNPGIFSSAEDFPIIPSQNSTCGALTVHEVAHGLDMVIRQQLDPYFFQELDDCYEAAMTRLVYKKAYAAANRHEYLAEICTLFVGTYPYNFESGCYQCSVAESGLCDWEPHKKFPPGKCGVPFRKKSDLIANDPMGYELLKSFLIEIKDPDDDSLWWE